MSNHLGCIVDNITIDSNNCWNWNKSCSSSGYGQIMINSIRYNVHRYVYEEVNGLLPTNLVVRHKCHNKKCCNPEHLISGTRSENYEDSREVCDLGNSKRRLKWIVQGVEYKTIREAALNTGLSNHSLIKYTDKETRIFDINTYRFNCEVGNRKPKI